MRRVQEPARNDHGGGTRAQGAERHARRLIRRHTRVQPLPLAFESDPRHSSPKADGRTLAANYVARGCSASGLLASGTLAASESRMLAVQSRITLLNVAGISS